MKSKGRFLVSMVAVVLLPIFLSGCDDTAEKADQLLVDGQQKIYQSVQPVHIYDYSIPRDVYQQIYDVVTTKAVATYTVIESITGVTRYEGPSVGFPIPADTSLTNPLQAVYRTSGHDYSAVIEQPEPNGLFPSKHTDATWVLFVDLESGEVYPVYSEHKATTFPFIVKKHEATSQWVRADNRPIAFKVEIKKDKTGKNTPPVVK